MRIPISEITVNPGRRELDLDDVKELADSIRELGLLHPIIVDKKYTLIAGLHRLEAVKLLEWTEIECTVSSLEGLKAELAEIDENVVRSDLSALEFGELLLKRKDIYEALHPEARATYNGGGFRGNQHKKTNQSVVGEESSATTKSFVQDTAEKLGVTPRTVEKQIQTARNLTPEVKTMIRETDTKIGKEAALKLSRMEPEQQKEAVEMLSTGEVRSVEQYSTLKSSRKKEEMEPCPEPASSNLHTSEHVSLDHQGNEPVSSDIPYRLPDRKFSSFEESVADLKDPNKDCSCTPDIFLAEYSGFIHKFIKDIKWYSTPQYTEVFPALTQIQVDYLRSQTKALCDAAEELLKLVERKDNRL